MWRRTDRDLPIRAELGDVLVAPLPLPVCSESEGRQGGHLDPWHSRRGPGALVPPGPAGSCSARGGIQGLRAQGSLGRAAYSPEHGVGGGDKRVENFQSWV